MQTKITFKSNDKKGVPMSMSCWFLHLSEIINNVLLKIKRNRTSVKIIVDHRRVRDHPP